MKQFFIVCLLGLFFFPALPSQALAQQNSSVQSPAFRPLVRQSRRDFFTAITLYQEKKFELSIDYFLRALKNDSQNTNIRYFLALAYYHSGNTQNAVSQWENLIKITGPDDILQSRINKTFTSYDENISVYGNDANLGFSLVDHIDLENIYQGASQSSKRKGFIINLPTALHVDNRGHILVLDARTGALVRLNRQGKVAQEIVGFTSQVFFVTSKFGGPNDFSVLPNGNFVVSDFAKNQIVRLDKNGSKIDSWSSDDRLAPGALNGPKGLSLDDEGNLYVADSGSSQIKKYNSKGDFIGSFGSRGTDKGELSFPSDVFFDRAKKKIYVVDRGNKRVQSFDRNGYFEDAFGEGVLKNPRRLASSSFFTNKLAVLDTDQVYLLDPEKKSMEGLIMPSDDDQVGQRNFLSLAFDFQGEMYVGNVYKRTIDRYAPTRLLYANLDLRFENVNLQKFPKVVVSVSVKDSDGHPIIDMNTRDFTILENGVPKKITKIVSAEPYRFFRPVVVVEKSLEARKSRRVIEIFLKNLLMDNPEIKKAQILGYGGERNNGYEKISSFTHLYRMAIDRLVNGQYHENFSLGKALRSAINISLGHSYKKAIVILAFSPHTFAQAGGDAFQSLVDFAAHNHVPVYVIYSGPFLEDDEGLTYLKIIAEKTGGKFYRYTTTTTARLMEDMNAFKDAVYRFGYDTIENPLNKGAFRQISITGRYQGVRGIDNRGGYAIP